MLADAPSGAFSDFAVRTFNRCPAARVLLVNLHPRDIPALGQALQAAATAGNGKPMTYWLKPEEDGTVRLLGQKPDRQDLEAGWRRDPVVHRYRPMKDVAAPVLTLPSGGMWSWSAHTLGITTGNLYAGPQILFPTACPRPLIGASERRQHWDAPPHFSNNTDRSQLVTHRHCLCPQAMTPEMCAAMEAEARSLPRSAWVAIFNDDWPAGGNAVAYSGSRAMATRSDDQLFPELTTWVNETVIPLLREAGVPTGVVNSCGYVRVDSGAPLQHPHRDVNTALVPPDAQFWSVFGAVSCDSLGESGGYWVPRSATGLPEPWLRPPLLVYRGDVMLLDSRLVHAGGTAPPAVPRRYVAFVALGDHPYNYDVTIPPWSPPTPSSGPSSVRSAAIPLGRVVVTGSPGRPLGCRSPGCAPHCWSTAGM